MIGCRFRLRAEREYSFLLTDFEKETAPLWFDGNVQKMVSVISQRAEVEKYFLWRQLDASANSLNMLASAHYPHAALVEKSNAEKHEMLFAKGVNWAKQAADFKRGRIVRRSAETNAWEIDLTIPVFNRDAGYLAALIP